MPLVPSLAPLALPRRLPGLARRLVLGSLALGIAIGSALPAVGSTPTGRAAVSAVAQTAPNPDCVVPPANAVRKADELMADRYDLGPHGTVTIPFPPSWAEDPKGDRNWRFFYHGL